MKRLIIPWLLMALLVTSCKPQATAPDTKADDRSSYAARGVVQSIMPDRRKASIKHEKIPGYMAAMTMDLSVKNTNEFAGISPGDEITFTLVVTDDDDWIENLQRTGKTLPVTAKPVLPPSGLELKPGDAMPDFAFMAEDGRTVKFSDFHGRALAFTFFFTSCPLPEYCPRMNKNFAEARRLLLAGTNAPLNWQLLCISFDPGFDTPEILSSYAGLYREGNPDRWLFAVAATNTLAGLAPKVDLNFWRENGSITHNLRTVVLDGSGKIFKQFDGNEWTAQQLADAIREAAKVK
jgi:protein SCO1/2